MGSIYFAAIHPDESVGLVKIGYTDGSVAKRVGHFQTGCPYPIDVYHVREGSYDDERALHERFRDYHVRGEWFRFEGEVLGFVAKEEGWHGLQS